MKTRCDNPVMCENEPIWSEVYNDTRISTGRHFCGEHRPLQGWTLYNSGVVYDPILKTWIFTMACRGEGQTKEKAWESAMKHYQDRPQPMPDDRHIREEVEEKTQMLVARVTQDGYLLGCTDRLTSGLYEKFWAEHYEASRIAGMSDVHKEKFIPSEDDEPGIVKIEVPEDMTESLLNHGTRAQEYSTGYEAWQEILRRGRVLDGRGWSFPDPKDNACVEAYTNGACTGDGCRNCDHGKGADAE